MVEFNEALFLINNCIERKEERIKSVNSLNRICFNNVYSKTDYPFFDNSAVDGYVFLLESITYDLKVNLYFIYLSRDVIFSGASTKEMRLNVLYAYEVCTGAFVPNIFNCILAKENISIYNNKIFFSYFPKINENIRIKGEGFKKNDLILSVYEKITSLKLSLLLTGGIEFIDVFLVPKILLLATGDELMDVGNSRLEGKIYSSNLYMIHSEINRDCILNIDYFFSNDNYETITKILFNFKEYNLVLVIGGMSFGKHDFTRDVFNKLSVREIFYLGNWKPGKPFFFGTAAGVFFFGIPGNPNSCYIVFKIFIEYFIKNFSGNFLFSFFFSNFFSLVFSKKNNCTFFLHGFLINNVFLINDNQNSNLINKIANSNSIIILDEFYVQDLENQLIKFILI